jgi:ABC-2 type transport system ATP-binding protein
MIRIHNLSHALGGKKVLENVNLSVPDGTIMGLVGINGAGKSTLLRLLSGVYLPDEGVIDYDGASPSSEVTRRDIFFLPDDPYFTHHTTVKSMFALYKAMYPVDEERYKRLITLFGLDEKTPLRNFSKGMRRQAYIAIALAIRPKYLFLDEAFDGLDPLARQKVKEELGAMADDNNSTVIISSHSLRELEDFCDKYTVIDRLTVSSSGDISERVEQYCKFMLAFADGFSENMLAHLPVVTMSASGKFVRAVFKGDSAEIEQKLLELSPAVIEEMNVDFEEVFNNEVSRGVKK